MRIIEVLPAFRLPDRLRYELKVSGLEIEEEQFSKLLLGVTLSSFLACSALLVFISIRYSDFGILYVLMISGLFSMLLGYSIYNRPFSLSITREKEIDANLIFAVRELSISMRTGATLADALKNAAPSGYLSEFLRKAWIGLSSSEPEEYVFGRLSKRTGNRYLQRLFAILMLSGKTNILPALEQYIQEVKNARNRKMQEYEIRSQLSSKILPLVFIGSASLILVFSIVGFHFSAHLPFPSVIALNFVVIPFAMLFLLQALKASNPLV